LSDSRLQLTLKEFQIPAFVQRADNATLARMIASSQTDDTSQPTPEKLPRYGLLYEKQGMKAFNRWISKKEPATRDAICENFQKAYVCWRTLASLPNDVHTSADNSVSSLGLQLVEVELQDELLSPELLLAFRLSIAGLLGERTAETRLDLRRFALTWQKSLEKDWRSTVAVNIFSAFARLVRKSNGWEDIQQALKSIAKLREMQRKYEETYLDSLDGSDQTMAALELMGLYHLVQLVTIVGEYLQTGEIGYDAVNLSLDYHHDQAVGAFEDGLCPLLAHLADLLWAGCKELVQNAIWTHVKYLGEHTRKYVQMLTSSARNQPVIELWPSQQEAFRRHLLDSYQRAILVEMPTSAGKTLLAKFAVIQTKALNPNGLVAYVVPTRALVNQVTFDFRMDFRHMLRVEQAVPAFEMDPTEERLLRSHIDVLVTTPEKLDLLVRSEHPIVKNIALVVADEAHNISDGERGTRLELLLSTIKRDFAKARFLLLSPFLPNPQELIQWLGEGHSLPPISISWKPNRKLVGSVRSVKNQDEWQLEFETFESAHSLDIRAGMKITIGQVASRLTSINAISKATAQALVRRGSVLILCAGPYYAVTRARQIADERPLLPRDEMLTAVCHYIEAELGEDCDLVRCLRHGVAYHHSGLSHETRWLIEELIRDSQVKIVCGTTTLAQGMNFPITTVIIETLNKGRSSKLSFEEFWNIAGRAGRTLVDTLGVVAFPTQNDAKREDFAEFLKLDAQEIARQLAQLIDRADNVTAEFNLQSLQENPQLSPLLQFLAHAMRVSGNENLSEEVEELLRASLVYHQIQKQNQQTAQKLVKICRAYLEQTRMHKDILSLADRTGFATPSVLSLLSQKAQSQELANPTNWTPERLFGEDIGPLLNRVKIIADLPEIRLGKDEDVVFDAQRAATILRDWVNGEPLEKMALLYGVPGHDRNRQIVDFSKYLFSILSRASWGIGALQTVCLGGNEQTNWNDVGYIPSMIFFGVRTKEAIWLRMVGVPRVVTPGLSQLWSQRTTGEPSAFDTVRSWISRISESDWQQVIPSGTALTPQDMRLIWKSISGE